MSETAFDVFTPQPAAVTPKVDYKVYGQYRVYDVDNWELNQKVAKGAGWCTTASESTFNNYTSGEKQIWVCHRKKSNGWKPCLQINKRSNGYEIAKNGNRHMQPNELVRDYPDLRPFLDSIGLDVTKLLHDRIEKLESALVGLRGEMYTNTQNHQGTPSGMEVLNQGANYTFGRVEECNMILNPGDMITEGETNDLYMCTDVKQSCPESIIRNIMTFVRVDSVGAAQTKTVIY